MANIVSIVSSKGGTGKTTVALNLAVALAEGGDRVLLIDADPL
ncbi:MAG: ParA family protein, partial [Geobacter sp.]